MLSKEERSKNRWLPRGIRMLIEYGITQGEYRMMYTAQEGKCKICAAHKRTLCVDHCHTTGKVRGLLCHRCNLMLGVIEQPTPANTAVKVDNIRRYLN